LTQQLLGIEPVFQEVQGKTVLDVGCAEGLIALAMFDAGARFVFGVEIVEQHIKVANSLIGKRKLEFVHADANSYQPVEQYDIVLMLAILQKLRDPHHACRRFARAAKELCVLRLPPKNAPLIIDERSGLRPFNMKEAMGEEGFDLTEVRDGPYNEWVGYFRRRVDRSVS
jgi:SAM-dependent methyltransferase